MIVNRKETAICLLVLWVLVGPAWSAAGTRAYLDKPQSWFEGPEAQRIAANLLSWQSESGGWPKNTDVAAQPYTGDRSKLRPTFDNRATTDELRFLAKIYEVSHRKNYKASFERGVDYILNAQYSTGGWPQFDPPGRKYHRHITFNDDAMVRLLNFLHEVCGDDLYAFAGADRRKAAQKAFDTGVDCILRCQIRVGGRPTAWCAQHDELDFSPRPARSFEPASISGAESVGIVRLLMSITEPGPDVVAAVDSAAAWFRKVELRGFRMEVHDGNKLVVKDPSAPPLWARFYEIGTDRPVYCSRDGVIKYELAEIDEERRNNYRWLGNWPQHLLEQEYPAWKKRMSQMESE